MSISRKPRVVHEPALAELETAALGAKDPAAETQHQSLSTNSEHIGVQTESKNRIHAKAQRVHQLLIDEYGEPIWHQHRDPVSELVLTILSQNTSDVNSGRAFQRLVGSFRDWEAVRDAPEAEIAIAIQSAGLSNIKAGRIKAILKSIEDRHGSLNLDFLQDWSVGEAKGWLRSLKGVGPKTAACVLLFSLGRPAMPVDTHVFRVSQRLGLIPPRASVEEAHELLEAALEPGQVYAFHINMITHGRQVCKAQRPRCAACVLYRVCDNPVMLPRYSEVEKL